ncbi:hypothetical protein [Phenylobacterium aquaticum]|uniref:hypothetical protein n=1 Tax=Phenylobacterium aquaticum TaxID=1763816 RepID=UPI001F5DA915|nr:hypothetical protein [Phenylobacterium aquaticum]MCI3133149.1 hypothetical protein [Phenylobacterium aquaticum]
MGKALGIAAFVVLLLSVLIPVVGTYITFLALAISAGAAFGGEKTWVLVVEVVSAVKIFFLSPTWHLMLFPGPPATWGSMRDAVNASREQAVSASHQMWLLTLFCLALPLGALAWAGLERESQLGD